eukprot:Cvel_23555.t1-p1 / transcript=Cvel_23555.t1 / gene=Cvel_23555 / organism=Chromera_velia_CCMP2878 / gene_product=hypothetical protein / transcript_product=hypothetical protein / location=Cvel_scaffold2441:821-1029(-) / protein_length=43 / sequence_SO=supercontig / SO=protein_coding / is_pseudo=false
MEWVTIGILLFVMLFIGAVGGYIYYVNSLMADKWNNPKKAKKV